MKKKLFNARVAKVKREEAKRNEAERSTSALKNFFFTVNENHLFLKMKNVNQTDSMCQNVFYERV